MGVGGRKRATRSSKLQRVETSSSWHHGGLALGTERAVGKRPPASSSFHCCIFVWHQIHHNRLYSYAPHSSCGGPSGAHVTRVGASAGGVPQSLCAAIRWSCKVQGSGVVSSAP